ncbi:NAD(P)H-dependent oxidoreductase [Wolbachia endosymbiont of Drosophila chauvacae]|nr:NAD(P)H-dependent oxidoreductase [Wolbachia endosymbiont of Drosophila chauvacae]
MKQLVIVNAGLGDPSTTRQVAEKIADATVRGVSAAGEGLGVEILDLRTLAVDLATYMTTFIPTDALQAARRTVTGADALIVATPVFQGSYSGLFKMFFDTLEMKALDGMPVTMVATAGTPRHSMVLDYAVRPLLSFLHAVVLPTGVFAATAEFGADSGLDNRVARAARELTAQLTAVRGVAGFTAPDVPGAGAVAADQDADAAPDSDSDSDLDAGTDPDFRLPAGGFAALLSGHTGR